MKQETLQLTGGNNKGTRRKLDFYPTPPECTIALMDFLNLDKSLVRDPACGNWALLKVVETYGHDVIGDDISNGHDFLLEPPIYSDVIITNPPFYIADKFILKSLKESRIVCMLLKSQYWHAAKRYGLFNQTKPAFILPLSWRPDFFQHERASNKKGSPTMEVLWTVWKRGSTLTQYNLLKKPSLITNKQQ